MNRRDIETRGKPESHPRPNRPDTNRRLVLLCVSVSLGLIVFAVFLPTRHCEFVDWDDPDTVVNNPHVHGLSPANLGWMFTTFYWGHYQPLVWLSYALDHTWARAIYGNGLNPAAYHLTSSGLHALAAVLVFLLARRLLAGRTGLALVAALLFALHPLRVEPVAWITGRGDLLVTVFLLLTVLAYFRAVSSRPTAPPLSPAPPRRPAKNPPPRSVAHPDPGRRPATAVSAERARYAVWLAVALACYVLALLSRAMAVTLPLVLLLLDIYPLRRLGGARGWLNRRVLPAWLEKMPFFAGAGVFAIVAAVAKAGAGSTLEFERHGLLDRLVQACFGAAFYLWKTLVPVNLSPIYELHLPMNLAEPRFVAGGLVVSTLLVALIVLRRRAPAPATALAAYALLLAPVLGFGQAGNQLAADRYSYLPSIPLAILVALGLGHTWRHAARKRPGRVALAAATAAALVSLAVLSVRQMGAWRSTAALWTHAAAVAPDSSIAQNGYGWVLLQDKQYDAALTRFRRALEIQPANDRAHNNIWIALREQGKTDELIDALRESTHIFPTLVEAHYNLGVYLQRAQRTDEAIDAYRAALRLRPDHSKARTNLGQLLRRRGQLDEAVQHLAAAVRSDPANTAARRTLAEALRDQQRTPEAIRELQEVLRQDPRDERAATLLRTWTADGR